MVHIAAYGKARIVVGSNDIGHLDICTKPLGKLHAAAYNHIGMVAPMCSIEAIVARQYLALNVRPYLLSNHSPLPHYHLNYFAALEVLASKVAYLLSSDIGNRLHTLLRSTIVRATHDILDCDICNAEGAIEDA